MKTSTFLNLIAERFQEFPNRPAIFTRGKYYSYSELGAQVQGIMGFLAASQDNYPLVGILTGDDLLTYASILAILFSGKGYVPVNHKNPPQRNAEIIRESGIKTLLISPDSEVKSISSEFNPGIFLKVLRDIVPVFGKISAPSVELNQIAYLLFTSGSTGQPKGVPIFHSNLQAFLSVMLHHDDYPFSEQDKFLQMVELTFDLSVFSIFLPWSLGACCCVVPDQGVVYQHVYKVLEQEKITVALMVPSVLNYLRPYFEEIKLPDLTFNLFCGEALYASLLQEWSSCIPLATIENDYGPTEATVMCLRYRWKRNTEESGAINGVVPIGKPFPGMEALILDEEGKEVPPGIKGELFLLGGQVTSGYWNNQEKTAAAFLQVSRAGVEMTGYRTGDACYLNEQGDFIFCGRLDSQVKIDGYRVELQEIEFQVGQFPGAHQGIVVAAPHGHGGVSLHLFLNNFEGSIPDLIAFLRGVLPVYMIPQAIHRVESLPLNLNGKIDRKKLQFWMETKNPSLLSSELTR